MLDLQVNVSFYSKRSTIGVINTVGIVVIGRNICTGRYNKRSEGITNTERFIVVGRNICAIFYGENSTVIVNTVAFVTVGRNICTALNCK